MPSWLLARIFFLGLSQQRFTVGSDSLLVRNSSLGLDSSHSPEPPCWCWSHSDLFTKSFLWVRPPQDHPDWLVGIVPYPLFSRNYWVWTFLCHPSVTSYWKFPLEVPELPMQPLLDHLAETSLCLWSFCFLFRNHLLDLVSFAHPAVALCSFNFLLLGWASSVSPFRNFSLVAASSVTPSRNSLQRSPDFFWEILYWIWPSLDYPARLSIGYGFLPIALSFGSSLLCVTLKKLPTVTSLWWIIFRNFPIPLAPSWCLFRNSSLSSASYGSPTGDAVGYGPLLIEPQKLFIGPATSGSPLKDLLLSPIKKQLEKSWYQEKIHRRILCKLHTEGPSLPIRQRETSVWD